MRNYDKLSVLSKGFLAILKHVSVDFISKITYLGYLTCKAEYYRKYKKTQTHYLKNQQMSP